MTKIISLLKPVLASLMTIVALSANSQNTERIAPEFTLTDIEGKKVSLSDFKGKVVYLDIWASWCGPCVAEIPNSKKLQEQFKDNPGIAFVNISLDRDTLQWKQKVKSKKMKGIQLLSPGGNESGVKNNYEVTTIPRFVIIDKKGVVREYFAKRPGEQGLFEDLSKLMAE